MAEDKGSVEIDVVVDASEAVDGFKKAGDAAEEMGKKLEDTEKAVKETGKELEKIKDDAEDLEDSFDDLGKKTDSYSGFVDDLAKRLGGLRDETESAGKALDDLGDEVTDLPMPEGPKKPLKENLPDNDDIEGLSRFRDVTGEADSAIAGMAAAADHVSPELANMMRLIGDTSGGMEAASRMTAVFGGTLGSLIRVAAPVGVAVGALAFAHSRLSKSLEEAEENLKNTHEEMEEGIAAAKAYESKIRALRVRVGLLAQAEADLRDARDEANSMLSEQNQAYDEATQRAGVYKHAIDLVEQAMFDAMQSTGDLNFEIADLEQAHEAATSAAEGEVSELERTSYWANDSAAAIEALRKRHDELTGALENENRVRDHYKKMREENTALILIDQAIMSEDVDKMIESREQLDKLRSATRSVVEAKLEAAIATQKQLDALENETEGIEKNTDAVEDNAKSLEELFAARMNLNRMLTTTAGEVDELQQIELNYLQALEDARAAINEAGGSEEEYTRLLNNAVFERNMAIAEYEAAQEEGFTRRKEVSERTIALEKTESEMIQAQYDNRMADLIRAHDTKQITTEQFHAQEILAEERLNEELANLRNQKAQENIAQVAQFGNAFLGMIDANISAVNARLDSEQEEALKRVQAGSEEAEEIQKEFDRRRQKELAAAYKKRQQLEIANAFISGASAIVAALAPPPVGAGPIAGPFLATLIAGTTGAQIATIQNQNPKFHDGGIVGGAGDQPITAQGGEVVLSREAVSELGGPDAANSLNEGGMAGGTTVIQMTYKQKVFDQIIVDNLAKGGPLKNALNTASRRGRRGRVGGRL